MIKMSALINSPHWAGSFAINSVFFSVNRGAAVSPVPHKRKNTYSWTFILHILSDVNKRMKNVLKSGSPSSFHAEECLHVCPHFICSNKKATSGIMMCIQTQK